MQARNIPPAGMPEIITPEPYKPESSPEEQLAAHVQAVRERGDPLDHMRTYRAGRPLAAAALAGTTAASFPFTAERPWTSILYTSAAVGAATFCIAKTYTKTEIKDRQEALKQFNEQSQAANDAAYELYRVPGIKRGTHDVTMVWHGVIEESEMGGDEQLGRIAELAKDAGVAKMLVTDELAHNCVGGSLPGQSSTMRAWLQQHKKLDTEGDTHTAIMHEATPDQWMDSAEAHIKHGRATKTVPLRRLGNVHQDVGGTSVVYAAAGITERRASHEYHFDVYVPSDKPEQNDRLGVVTMAEPLKPVDVPYGMQHDIVTADKKGRSRPNLSRQIKVAAGLAVASMVTLIGAQTTADTRLSSVERQASAKIARQHGADPQTADVDPEAARKLATRWHGINGEWGSWKDTRIGLYDKLAALPGKLADVVTGNTEAADLPGSAGLSGLVGNIDPNSGPGIAHWQLAPHNMTAQDLQGNWTIATGSTLYATSHRGETRVGWEIDEYIGEDDLPDGYMGDPSHELSKHQSYVVAEAPLDTTQVLPYYDKSYLPIPVHDDMSVFAATIGGELATINHQANGTYMLELPAGKAESGEPVRYWLDKGVPQGDITNYWAKNNKWTTTGPRAVNLLKIETQKGADVAPYNPQAIERVIGEHYPELKDSTDTGALSDWMHTGLKYRLNPLDDGTIPDMKGWDGFLDDVLDGGKANCNVAVTSFALGYRAMNPASTVNNVVSYSNQKDPLVLSAGEGHSRAVTQDGKIYEPTPGGALGLEGTLYAADNARSNESKSGSEQPLWPYGVGVLTIAAMYAKRRKLAAAGKAGAQLARAGVVAANAGTYRARLAKLEHATWGRPGTQPDRTYVRRRRRDTAVSGTQARQALTQLRKEHAAAARAAYLRGLNSLLDIPKKPSYRQ